MITACETEASTEEILYHNHALIGAWIYYVFEVVGHFRTCLQTASPHTVVDPEVNLCALTSVSMNKHQYSREDTVLQPHPPPHLHVPVSVSGPQRAQVHLRAPPPLFPWPGTLLLRTPAPLPPAPSNVLSSGKPSLPTSQNATPYLQPFPPPLRTYSSPRSHHLLTHCVSYKLYISILKDPHLYI